MKAVTISAAHAVREAARRDLSISVVIIAAYSGHSRTRYPPDACGL
jgi:hypothetical protein